MSKSSFSQVLQFITSIKLQELDKQRLAYKNYMEVIEEANASGNDHVARVEILLEGVRSWTGSGSVTEHENNTVGGKLDLTNLTYWLRQAKNDPSFSPDIAGGWADTLESHIRHNMMRFDCARLFGMLFSEWLSSGDSSTVAYQSAAEDAATEASFESEFVNEGRKELYEQRERLESIIFQDKPIDKLALTKYLEGLFSGEDGERALAMLRRSIKKDGHKILRRRLNPQDVKDTIRGLLVTGLMDEEKRATLSEFLNNDTVIEEVASVLNMRLADLQNWSWPAEGILVEMRRHLNGKYRAFMDPEIIDALLLHYLGIAWQVNLRHALTGVYHGKAWKRTRIEMSRLDIEKQMQQLPGRIDNFIVAQRNKLRESLFFLNQLSDTMGTTKEYDDVVDGASDSSVDSERPSVGLSPVQIKQKLLHMMTTENYLNTALHGSFAVIRSDLEWFGPSLSHETILTVLEFFGFDEEWLSFFRTFLQAPLRFTHDKKPQVRKCGTPIGYTLSTVCGEAVLFGLDLTVNQKVHGLFLQRLHDDLWIWDSDASKCAAAWKEMNTYAQLSGLTFNKEKTGSAYVGNGSPDGLPSGVIRWGFLRFNSSKARFVIDQKEVDVHIGELKRQLAFTKSVFGWVNAYNKYMEFFLRNFGGRPANCFGEAHVEDIIQTLARIQRELFPGAHDSADGHLRTVIEQRFDVKNLPEGYFYSPIGSGGLELRNTMLEVLAIPQTDREYPIEETFTRAIQMDEENYKIKKEAWELNHLSSDARSRIGQLEGNTPKFDTFYTYEEYISKRETCLEEWSDAYENMLEVPRLEHMASSPALDAMLAGSKDKSWESMNWYDRWITSLYGEELVKKFGGLAIVDPTLIPVGMVQLFRSSRMKLDQ